jgi:hypothetical protein
MLSQCWWPSSYSCHFGWSITHRLQHHVSWHQNFTEFLPSKNPPWPGKSPNWPGFYHLVMTFTVCHGKIHPFLIGKPSNGHVSHNQRVSWYFSMGKMAHLPGSFRQGSPAVRFGKGNPCSLTVPQLLQVHQTRGSGTRGQVLRVKFWGWLVDQLVKIWVISLYTLYT